MHLSGFWPAIINELWSYKLCMKLANFFVRPPQVKMGTSVVSEAIGMNDWPGNTWNTTTSWLCYPGLLNVKTCSQHTNRTELNWHEQVDPQLHDTFVGYARLGLYTSHWLAAAKVGRSVVGKFSAYVSRCGRSQCSSRTAVGVGTPVGVGKLEFS